MLYAIDDEEDWTPAPGECSACGIPIGEGQGECRPATGSTLCLECATLYYPPTDDEEHCDDDHARN